MNELEEARENLHASEKMREDLRKVLNLVCDERDKALRGLADVWDEGYAVGWHMTDFSRSGNPYRLDKPDSF